MIPDAFPSQQERILAVLAYIQQHLSEDLDRNHLAEVARLSPCHFSRIFKRLVGEGVREHIRRLRLEQAAARLRFDQEGVVAIALDSGFESHEAFTRAFASRFGMPPSRYRRVRSRRVRLDAPFRKGHAAYRPLPTGALEVPVRVEPEPARRVAFAREVGPYREAGERAWRKLLAWAVPLGLIHEGTEWIGRSLDDPEVTPPDQTRYEAAIPVPANLNPCCAIGVQTLPGGRYATLRYTGPMAGEAEGWYRLLAWMADHGHRVDFSSSFKIYRTPLLPEPPAEIVSDLYILLAEDP